MLFPLPLSHFLSFFFFLSFPNKSAATFRTPSVSWMFHFATLSLRNSNGNEFGKIICRKKGKSISSIRSWFSLICIIRKGKIVLSKSGNWSRIYALRVYKIYTPPWIRWKFAVPYGESYPILGINGTRNEGRIKRGLSRGWFVRMNGERERERERGGKKSNQRNHILPRSCVYAGRITPCHDKKI